MKVKLVRTEKECREIAKKLYEAIDDL